MELPAGFALAAVLEREDPRDAFVSHRASPRWPSCRRAPWSAPRSLRRVVQLLRPAARPAHRAAARQPRHAAAQARRRPVRRHRAGRRRAEAPGPGRAHPPRCSTPTQMTAGGRAGRAGHRGPRRTRPSWGARWPRWCTGPAGWRCMPSARCRARWAAAAACRWRRMRCGTASSCASTRRWAMRRSCRARCCARSCARAWPARPRPMRWASAPRRSCAPRGADSLSRRSRLRPRAGPRSRMRIIVTRPRAQADALVAELRARRRGCRGAAADRHRAGRPTRSRCSRPGASCRRWRLVMFVSANAVQHFLRRGRRAAPGRPALLAGSTGPGTSAALRAGRRARGRARRAAGAQVFDSEALWARLRQRDWQGRRVLVVRGEGGRDWLAEQLAQAGARVEFVAAYQRVLPQLDAGRSGAAAMRRWRGRSSTCGSSAARRRWRNLRAAVARRRLVGQRRRGAASAHRRRAAAPGLRPGAPGGRRRRRRWRAAGARGPADTICAS